MLSGDDNVRGIAVLVVLGNGGHLGLLAFVGLLGFFLGFDVRRNAALSLGQKTSNALSDNRNFEIKQGCQGVVVNLAMQNMLEKPQQY